ncbi:hypothetical protein DV735_g3803, partial [Chaetothyriales sp. CBS 134920]
MIGNSTAEYIFVITSAAILHSIGPASFLFSILYPFLPQSWENSVPRKVKYWLFTEAVFFVLTYIYIRWHVQNPAEHPAPMSRQEREKLFQRCLDTTGDHEEYYSKWFFGQNFHAIRRENIKEFFRYAFLYTDLSDPEHNEELDMPHALIGARQSASENLSYWYQPHTSPNELPILFLHGIGVGLFPYMGFLTEINRGRDEKKDGKIGILAVEILPISSRVTTAMFRKDDLCDQLRGILHRHGFDRFVVMGHSYGTVISTHLLKTPDLASRISSVILVDPISILLNQPDVAYNFTARPPKSAVEWFFWYYGSRDIGVAHTLFRTFFWSENILWKEDILNHRCIVFLGEKDSIVNAPKVLAYLREEGYVDGRKVAAAVVDGHMLENGIDGLESD